MLPCVLIATYNNDRTLEGVVRGALRQCPDVIVVDDGATDRTTDVLSRIPEAVVVRHAANLGKGRALRTGFAEAVRRGFTHAVCLDSDGQHSPDDIESMLAAARREPAALVLGVRPLAAAGAGLGSRLGCMNSNFWTWVETGLRLPDTQTGFRVYPLAGIGELALARSGFDFEIEVLVKAAWTGIPIVSIPVSVRYFHGSERVSHFRPARDFLRISLLNTRLVLRRLFLPAPILDLVSRSAFVRLGRRERLRTILFDLFVREPGSPARVALSAALGIFIGLAPIWGFQLVVALLLAERIGLSKTVAALATNISFPILVPGILWVSLVLGRVLLGNAESTGDVGSVVLKPDDFPAWILGSFVLAAVAAMAGGIVVFGLMCAGRAIRRSRAERR